MKTCLKQLISYNISGPNIGFPFNSFIFCKNTDMFQMVRQYIKIINVKQSSARSTAKITYRNSDSCTLVTHSALPIVSTALNSDS